MRYWNFIHGFFYLRPNLSVENLTLCKNLFLYKHQNPITADALILLLSKVIIKLIEWNLIPTNWVFSHRYEIVNWERGIRSSINGNVTLGFDLNIAFLTSERFTIAAP